MNDWWIDRNVVTENCNETIVLVKVSAISIDSSLLVYNSKSITDAWLLSDVAKFYHGVNRYKKFLENGSCRIHYSIGYRSISCIQWFTWIHCLTTTFNKRQLKSQRTAYNNIIWCSNWRYVVIVTLQGRVLVSCEAYIEARKEGANFFFWKSFNWIKNFKTETKFTFLAVTCAIFPPVFVFMHYPSSKQMYSSQVLRMVMMMLR